MTEFSAPLCDDEFVVLEAVVIAGGDQPFSTIARWFSLDAAQAAVTGLLNRGLVAIDRVDLLPEGQTVDRPVSPLTPSVPSTSRENVSELPSEEAAEALSDPGSWLPSVHATTWFEVAATDEAEAAYNRAAENRRA